LPKLTLPPLSLYVHIPWCVQKCPYCDFNSHGQNGDIPEQAYIQALLNDLDQEHAFARQRPLHSIFIGGGTPSLLSGEAIQTLLDGIRSQFTFEANMEVTMEANPGTAEAARFYQYHQAGVNRLSIGVQSFDDKKLNALGRIHSGQEAILAAKMAKQAGFTRLNLDLMHGLPGQTLDSAMADLTQAIALEPTHLSWYQLTIEPNTRFASRPPALPGEDILWDIFEQGSKRLSDAGLHQYEVSAYSLSNEQSRHNLNYWRFGDYIGIGCGAHGKLTDPDSGQIVRREKVRHPKGYLESARNFLDKQWQVDNDELAFEYFLNRLRLFEPIPKNEFDALTGLDVAAIQTAIEQACKRQLMNDTREHWEVTNQGRLFLNDLLELFLKD
jgi:oxygen-independent coproporphyrinogen-3 oxidase